ncbi:MAG: FMN-binding negative transcriptional regulator [Actinomycetota bacterium]|nr:FMN-binding negative transcriptional regulator [Actinomycetota bacterium]
MLIHPWDRPLDDAEWRSWLAGGRNFGQLVVNGPDGWPVVVPTHFRYRPPAAPARSTGVAGAGGSTGSTGVAGAGGSTGSTGVAGAGGAGGSAGGEVLIHLARPNPVWRALERSPRAVLSVLDDYVFVPGEWRTADGEPARDGVPTSYYATVQLLCDAEIVDDEGGKAAIVNELVAALAPDGPTAPVVPGQLPFGRLLPGIRGLRLSVVQARVKFKYDAKKPVEKMAALSDRLAARGGPRDTAARAHQLRRVHDRNAYTLAEVDDAL